MPGAERWALQKRGRSEPVSDFGGQSEALEGGQQAGHALLKALRLPRVARRGHYRHIDVGPHQRNDVPHLHPDFLPTQKRRQPGVMSARSSPPTPEHSSFVNY